VYEAKNLIEFYKTNNWWSLTIKRPDDKWKDVEGIPNFAPSILEEVPTAVRTWCGPFADALKTGFDVYLPQDISFIWHGESNYEVLREPDNNIFNAHHIAEDVGAYTSRIATFGEPTPSNVSIYTGYSIKTKPGYGLWWHPALLHQSPLYTIDTGFVMTDVVTYHYWLNVKVLRMDVPITLPYKQPIARLLVLPIDVITKLEQQTISMGSINDNPEVKDELRQYIDDKYHGKTIKTQGTYLKRTANKRSS